MSPSAVYLTLGALADLAGVGALVWWFNSRRRFSAEILTRAEAHGRDIRDQAERTAETIRKEAQLEAREKAHGMIAEAEDRVRTRRQEIVALEQGLADRTRTLADRVSATDALERDLRARDASLAEREAFKAKALAGVGVKEALTLVRSPQFHWPATLYSDKLFELSF